MLVMLAARADPPKSPVAGGLSLVVVYNLPLLVLAPSQTRARASSTL